MSTAFAHPRLLSIVILLALTISAGGAEPPAVEWQTDYQLAHKSRLQRQKPMIVYITMDGINYAVTVGLDRMISVLSVIDHVSRPWAWTMQTIWASRSLRC